MTAVDSSAMRAELSAAEQRLNAGDLLGAAALCSRMLAAEPTNPHPLQLLGLVAFRQGNLSLAIEKLRSACASDVAPAACFANLAELLRIKGDLIEAEAAARKALAKDKTSTTAWLNLGVILQEAGKLAESKACLEQLLQREPDNAQAHNSLGMTCVGLGDSGQAEKHWKLALENAPGFSTPASNLSNLYCKLGSVERAIHYGRIAVGGSPRTPYPHLNLAAALSAGSNLGGALEVLEKALAVWPKDPSLLSAKATVLHRLDMPALALEAAERAVDAAPGSADAQFSLATALRASSRAEQAAQAFQRAADAGSGPAREKALLNRALALNEIGRSRDAFQALSSLIEEFPGSAHGYYYRTQLKRVGADDPDLERMRTLRSRIGDAGESALLLDFALGKALMDIGEHAEALQHIHRGNRIKRQTFDYDADGTTRWFEQIAAASSKEQIDSHRSRQIHSRVPVFIVGMPRSGTTLIEQILASHSRVHGAGELRLIDRLSQRLGGFPNLLLDTRNLPVKVDRLGLQYMSEVERLSGGRSHIVNKMPSNFIYLGLIAMAFPSAKIIHVKRGAVDTCFSCYCTLFADQQAFAYEMTELARFYKDYERLAGHWEMNIPTSQLIRVRYEEMIQDTELQSRRLIDFLGLDWEEACLQFHRTKRPVRTASVNQVRQEIFNTSIGRWKNYETYIGPLLKTLGNGM
jgi:tetratricopeptide (TPR) repeat protein